MDPTITNSYTQFVVAGKALDEWLTTGDNLRKNVKAWLLIQLCFGFYHEYGPFLVEEDVVMLLECANSLPTFYRETIQMDFMILLYHWVVGKYGHIPANESYQDEVDMIRTQLENGSAAVFFLFPSQTRNAIPCPHVTLETTEEDTTPTLI